MAQIRPYRSDDLGALYEVCLATGDAGADASGLYADPELIGNVFAAPYGVLAPETAFVIEDQDGVGGYVLGALDTPAFEAAAEARWWPALRPRYADPTGSPPKGWSREQQLHWVIHHPIRTPERIAEPFPAHVHIDLLPRFQGRGLGRRMLDLWFDTASAMGSKGVHLGVSVNNARALRFYPRYGLAEPTLQRPAPRGTVWFAKAF